VARTAERGRARCVEDNWEGRGVWYRGKVKARRLLLPQDSRTCSHTSYDIEYKGFEEVNVCPDRVRRLPDDDEEEEDEKEGSCRENEGSSEAGDATLDVSKSVTGDEEEGDGESDGGVDSVE